MEAPPPLRDARASDAPRLAEILIAAAAGARPTRRRTRSDRSVAYDLEHRVLPAGSVWVALRRGEVVGFAAVADGSLLHLHVLPEAQAKGIGRALLGRAVERSAPGLRARVPADDVRTLAFLGARGFVWTGDVDVGGEPHEELRGPGPEPAWW